MKTRERRRRTVLADAGRTDREASRPTNGLELRREARDGRIKSAGNRLNHGRGLEAVDEAQAHILVTKALEVGRGAGDRRDLRVEG